jgi:hypothetical protein
VSASFAARFAEHAKRAELAADCGPVEGWVSIADLSAGRFDIAEAYFAAWQRAYPGLDRRGGAAYLIGGLAYSLTGLMVALRLANGGVPDLSRVVIALDGSEIRYRLPEDLSLHPATALDMARALEAVLDPLVARLKIETRLAPAAQWRCVADSFASAHLYTGRYLGAEVRTRDEAARIINHPCLKMANPQTGYRDVSIQCSDGRAVSQAFLRRGGCCRYYTADGAEYCTTCVLRPEAEQVARLEKYMHEVHEPAVAAE